MAQDEWLEFTAKLSIFSSIFIVIYFLGYAVVRIARMPNPPWKEWKTVKNRAVEVYKKPVELSFVLRLKEDSTQSLNRVTFHLKTNCRAEIKLLWGVSVTYLFELMRCSWNDFQNNMTSTDASASDTDTASSHSSGETCHSIVDCPFPESADGTFDDLISVFTPPTLKWEDLINKYRYPLAIVIYRPEVRGDYSERNFEGGNEIHGLFTILHVKSDTFPMPTTVLAHYIKMDNGNTFLLKPLYLVEDDTLTDDEAPLTQQEPPQDPADGNVHPVTSADVGHISSPSSFPGVSCSVCQTLPVSRAILPCGHVCLCVHCFERVERCPICRGDMKFFFRTRDEDYATLLPNEQHELPRHRSWFDHFEDWNDRINNWLGFHH